MLLLVAMAEEEEMQAEHKWQCAEVTVDFTEEEGEEEEHRMFLIQAEAAMVRRALLL
jgi:hypothetical protein